jgi:hypothetical protein
MPTGKLNIKQCCFFDMVPKNRGTFYKELRVQLMCVVCVR